MPEYTYDDIVSVKDLLTGRVEEKDILYKYGWFVDSVFDLESAIPSGCLSDAARLKRAIDNGSLDTLKYGQVTCVVTATLPFFADHKSWHSFFILDKDFSYANWQTEWVKKNNLKPGDKVKVLRSFEIHECDFDHSMTELMTQQVGKILEVKRIRDPGIYLSVEKSPWGMLWPYFVLEKVEDNALKQVESIPESQLRGYYNSRKPEYTEADIISDINDPRLEGSIGKVCYVAHHLYDDDIVANANNDDKTHKGILINLGYDPAFPFEVHTEMGLHWKQIIIAKNQPSQPEYVPFDLSREEDRQLLRGKWLRSNQNREEMITGFHMFDNGKWTADMSCFANATGDGLFRLYTFLDGTPCGKQIASK